MKKFGNVSKLSLMFEWGMLRTPPEIRRRLSNFEVGGCRERGKEQRGEGFEKSDHYLLTGVFFFFKKLV